ncbi:MAG: EAL and HDOD domain-containing protein [Phycisphaerae bacterium]
MYTIAQKDLKHATVCVEYLYKDMSAGEGGVFPGTQAFGTFDLEREMEAFVARQPIFDREGDVFGYELLFRNGLDNFFPADMDADQATLDVIAGSFLVIGLDDLTEGRRGFINFTRNLLLQSVPELLPNEGVVIEILENIQPDEQTLAACRKLRKAGYMLALDDATAEHVDSAFVELADIVKVDFMATTPEQQRELYERFSPYGVALLGEKVETQEEYQRAREWGYEYFQGYFFSKPVIRSGEKIPMNRMTYVQILTEANSPQPDYAEIQDLMKQDPGLTYKFLRFMNSAWFGFSAEIHSVHHALVLLGPKEIRKWFSLLALSKLGEEKPSELIFTSLLRARTCEALAGVARLGGRESDLFLVGLFSVIDAFLDMTMAEALERIPLDSAIKRALLGESNELRSVLDMAIAHETGAWEAMSQCAAGMGIREEQLLEPLSSGRAWARQAVASW